MSDDNGNADHVPSQRRAPKRLRLASPAHYPVGGRKDGCTFGQIEIITAVSVIIPHARTAWIDDATWQWIMIEVVSEGVSPMEWRGQNRQHAISDIRSLTAWEPYSP
jgi:hypothetical protein